MTRRPPRAPLFPATPLFRSVLCLNPTASLRPSRGAPFGALGIVSRGLAGVEALALERRGAKVTVVAPDSATATAMGDRKSTRLNSSHANISYAVFCLK